ncbi:ArnT family glycosyltransferase [Massilia yuzhufengensis]|uniref:4-amino-4-deoxy-L-arabinose transferase n=1 Tax=Massilia yuzhufengensis TaxID=1164594 RepID=A0A1I1V129_9BURK|nr:glycosyltransferase [Massilia yuzhufengensis]SFD73980.1 4-amino-4-deoxy-L-arabinose transferase [Massilia yuzhufengensis]
MKPVRLPAAATLALPRWALLALGMLYILPGLIGRDPWKEDAGSFGIMWTMAHGGLDDWLYPNIAGLAAAGEGPLAFWLGAACIKLFGWILGDVLAARVSTIGIFVTGAVSLWYTAFHLGRRAEAQPLRLAFGGQPEPDDYGRTLGDTAVLIYLGCLGLLVQSHLTLAATLQGALLAYFLYRAVRYVETASPRNAVLVGLSLGALALTRGMLAPAVLVLALYACTRYLKLATADTLRHLAGAAAVGFLITLVWLAPAALMQPYGLSPVGEWLDWNAGQLGFPGAASVKGFFRIGVWFFWPAWPFALWAIWAWRRQQHLLHIVMPVMFFGALTLLLLCDPAPENGDFLKMLAPLALIAAFGLPTMKRGAINAIDWFSVMVLTILGALVWLFWIAKLTGWPAQLSHNALKLVPGFKPEVGIVAFAVAAATSIGWIMLVHWRLSRQPSVLWRAVVLSSSGLILLWVLLMTLFLPELNYGRSYAAVAQQIAARLPHDAGCIDTNAGPAQRASFAYFGRLPFATMAGGTCNYVLLQDNIRNRDARDLVSRYGLRRATLLWEGRRVRDSDERFRLFQRAR